MGFMERILSFTNSEKKSKQTIPNGNEDVVIPYDNDKLLVLLDFDNVFNTLSIFMGNSPWDDGIVSKASMPSGIHGFAYSPTVANFFIERLDKSDTRWMSTWFEETTHYGEVMGFPTLPCLVSGDLSIEINAPWWKFIHIQRIVEEFPDQKILWVDDEIPKDANDPIRLWLEEHKETVSFVSPDDFTGLIQEDLDYMEILFG